MLGGVPIELTARMSRAVSLGSRRDRTDLARAYKSASRFPLECQQALELAFDRTTRERPPDGKCRGRRRSPP